MDLIDRLFGIDKRVSAEVERRTTELGKSITTHLDETMSKAMSPTTPGGERLPRGSVMRYAFNPTTMNNNIAARKKPGQNSIPYDVLRKFSISHEVSRAAINYRKRQIAGLAWDIVTEDTEQTQANEEQVAQLKAFFKQIGGRGNKYRKFMAKFVEDLLVLDAIALYKQPTRGGQLYTILPVDATTIRLRVDESGAIPEPPETAYKQVIMGKVVAEFTADEMIYDMMNPRNDSPYGLAPLESLMVVVSSSLKAGLYNLGYLTEGNIPEGFFGVPKEWTPQMIKDFQENWDAVMAGDETATAKLRFAPEGSYQPTKKPTDMAWESFNEWLMRVTCALFDVDPVQIGFPPKAGLGGKGFSEEGAKSSDKRGLLPLAQFVEEIFTELIQFDLGAPTLKFKYMGLEEERNAKEDAEVKQIMLATGQRTIDELRTDDGLDPLPEGAGEKPYIIGTPTFIDKESLEEAKQAKADAAAAATARLDANSDSTKAPTDEKKSSTDSTAKMVALVGEFRKFRKMALARKKAGKSFRPFESTVLPQPTVVELNTRIEKAETTDEVKGIFSEFMQDYQIDFLADVIELHDNLQKVAG